MYAVEECDEVVHVGQEIRQNDDVERLSEVESSPGRLDEPKVRVPPGSRLDHDAAQVDADAARGPQRRKEIPRAAADLEHRLPGGTWNR